MEKDTELLDDTLPEIVASFVAPGPVLRTLFALGIQARHSWAILQSATLAMAAGPLSRVSEMFLYPNTKRTILGC